MIAIDPVTESCIADEVEQIACATRVFISMPYVKGVTPHVLADVGKREHTSPEGQGERLYGIFRIDEVGIPAFDHGLLYGDAVFEGILISSRQLFQWREHVERLYRSAALLQIDIPYSPSELTTRVLETVKETPAATNEHAYIRLIVSRGIGDLGLHPRKCAGSTICAIVSQIRLYAPFLYERGISLALAQRTRRSSANILNPQIKCCNYVNQVLALLETMDEDASETVMLTSEGFIAEATADNIFVVSRSPGWEYDPGKITLTTPTSDYCLKGITRDLVLAHARALGFHVCESVALVPEDLLGTGKEVFLTGTAAGIVPVVSLQGVQIGSGVPGPVTAKLHDLLEDDVKNGEKGLSMYASKADIDRYFAAAIY